MRAICPEVLTVGAAVDCNPLLMLDYYKESLLERAVISGLASHPSKTCLKASEYCTVTVVRLCYCSSKTYPAAGLLTPCTALQSEVTSCPAQQLMSTQSSVK